MAWIKMNTGLLENPRVEAIADATGLDTYATAGRLLKLWVWVDANSEDGVGVMTTDERIDKRVECDGFAAAMRLVGWLSGDAHSVTFVRFTEHNGATAKRRAQSAQRNAKYRENGDSEQISQCIESGDAPVTLGASPREEKRREEKSKYQDKSAATASGFDWESDCPPSLKTPEAAAAFARWQAYRREAKLGKWKPVTIRAALAKFEPHGAPAFIAAIDKSISNGWRGLFEPDGGTTTTRKNDRNTYGQDAASKADLLARMKSTRQPTEARHAS